MLLVLPVLLPSIAMDRVGHAGGIRRNKMKRITNSKPTTADAVGPRGKRVGRANDAQRVACVICAIPGSEQVKGCKTVARELPCGD